MSSKIPAAKTPLLPDPNKEKSITDRSVTASANVEIDKSLEKDARPSRKRRGSHFSYDAEQRLKIAKFANEHGLTVATQHFSSSLGHVVPITTIQSIRDTYRKKLRDVQDPSKILFANVPKRKTIPRQRRDRLASEEAPAGNS